MKLQEPPYHQLVHMWIFPLFMAGIQIPNNRVNQFAHPSGGHVMPANGFAVDQTELIVLSAPLPHTM